MRPAKKHVLDFKLPWSESREHTEMLDVDQIRAGQHWMLKDESRNERDVRDSLEGVSKT